jgi:hypothetical protein
MMLTGLELVVSEAAANGLSRTRPTIPSDRAVLGGIGWAAPARDSLSYIFPWKPILSHGNHFEALKWLRRLCHKGNPQADDIETVEHLGSLLAASGTLPQSHLSTER